jgi:PAS domain S-box-containing protein
MANAKTKKELLAEIEALQQRVAALEVQLEHYESGTALPGSRGEETLQTSPPIEPPIPALNRPHLKCDRFLELSLDLLVIGGFDGYFRYINAAWEKTLGFTKAEILTTSFWELIHPDDRVATEREMQKLALGIASQGFENRYRCKDGSYKWLGWTSNIWLEDGLLYAVARDVSDAKQTETALRQSEEVNRILLNANPNLMIRMTRDGTYLNFIPSKDFINIMISREMVGKKIFELMPATVAQERMHYVELALATGITQVYEFEFEWQGKTLYEEAQISVSGEDEVLVIIRDISDRKRLEHERDRAETALRQTATQLQLITDNIPAFVAYLDAQLHYRFVNQPYADWLGFSKAEILSKAVLQEVSPSLFEAICPTIANAPVQENVAFAYAETTQNGQTKYLNVTLIPNIEPAENRVNGYFILATDITAQKLTEQSLEQQNITLKNLIAQRNAELRTIIDAIPEHIFVISRDEMRITYCNDTFAQENGAVSHQAMEGKTIFECYTPADAAKFVQENQSVFELGQSIRVQQQIALPNGTVHFDTIKVPLRNLNGEIYALVGAARDITPLRQIEAELEQREQQLRLLIEHSPIALAMFDREMNYLAVSRRWIKDYKLEDRNLIGCCHYQVFPDLPEHWRQVNERCQTGAVEKCEEDYYVQADGTVKWVRWEARPWYTTTNEIGGIIIFSENITDRKRTEDALRQSEERFRTSVESMLDGFSIMTAIRDPNGKISDFRFEYINSAGCQSNRMPKESVLGHAMCEVFPSHRETGLFDEYCQVVETGEPLIKESLVYEDDYAGQHLCRAFDIQATKLGDGFAVTWRDVTDRKKADESLKASLQEKEVLLKEIHHRVKNNLQIITSLIKLQSESVQNQQIRAVLKESQNRIRAMALIHEKLYRSPDLARTDLAAYVSDLTQELTRSYGLHPQTIQLHIQIEDILLNINTAIPCGLIINELVSNSLKYAFPNQQGNVWVQCRLIATTSCELIVGDDGIGLPSDFDFQNTESLGLQLVCGLTRQVGGDIQLDRTQGTQFRITVPIER